MRNRQRLIALCLAMFSFSGVAAAAPCVAGSLTSYVALGASGCSVAGASVLEFAVENFPNNGAVQIPADSILLTPTANGFMLSSGTPLSATADQLLGLRFLFLVVAPALTGGTVALGDGAVVTGDGVITGLLDAGAAGNAIALAIEGFTDSPASFASAARGTYAAFFELGIDGGEEGSALLGPQLASLTFTTAAVTPVPEPSIAALSLVGLIGVVAMRRRRSRGRV